MVKYCKHCGAQIEEDKKFCPECGKPTNETTIVKNTIPQKQGMSTGKKVGIVVVGLIVLFILIGLAMPSSNNTAEESSLSVSGISITNDGYGLYSVAGTIVPDKDYSYLEMQIIFYDSSGAIIEKCPLVWNINDANKGQTLKISGSAYCQNTPAKAEVQIFDSSLSTDSDEAIYTTEISM